MMWTRAKFVLRRSSFNSALFQKSIIASQLLVSRCSLYVCCRKLDRWNLTGVPNKQVCGLSVARSHRGLKPRAEITFVQWACDLARSICWKLEINFSSLRSIQMVNGGGYRKKQVFRSLKRSQIC